MLLANSFYDRLLLLRQITELPAEGDPAPVPGCESGKESVQVLRVRGLPEEDGEPAAELLPCFLRRDHQPLLIPPDPQVGNMERNRRHKPGFFLTTITSSILAPSQSLNVNVVAGMAHFKYFICVTLNI
jgi:hypothetical protein